MIAHSPTRTDKHNLLASATATMFGDYTALDLVLPNKVVVDNFVINDSGCRLSVKLRLNSEHIYRDKQPVDVIAFDIGIPITNVYFEVLPVKRDYVRFLLTHVAKPKMTKKVY